MRAHAVRIRRADPEADRDRVTRVLSRNLPAAAGEERYAWLYLENPCGPSRVWLAEDEETGEAVGTSAGHPKRVRVQGKIELALNLGDFAMDRAYRSLGPGLRLLRATLAPMDGGEFAFSYEQPSEAMLAIYARMGGQGVGRYERWVRVLDARPILKRRWGDNLASSIAGSAGNAALRARDALKKRSHVSISPLAGPFGDEFDRLEEDLADTAPVRLVRSSDYLRWRYRRSAAARHEILCARAGARLLGYLVVRDEVLDVLTVIDLVTAPGDAEVREALIREAVSLGRACGKHSLVATVLRRSRASHLFPDLGFRLRESSSGMAIYGPPETMKTLRNPANWWIVEGDQDV